MMKKMMVVMVILICVLGTGQVSSGLSVEVNSEINRVVRIGVDSRMPPYTYINENGIVKGFNIDILRAAAIEAGVDIELHPVQWYEFSNSLENGEIDAFISSENYENGLMYSKPLIESHEAIFVRDDNKFVVNLDDLRTAKVAIHTENLIPEVLRHLNYESDLVNIHVVDSQQQGIQMLMNKDVEAFIGNHNTGLYIIQKWMQEDYIKTVGDPINVREYTLITQNENEALIDLFNQGLNSIESNGTYDKIFSKWFGETLDSYQEDLKEVLIITGIVILAILAISLFILRLNSLLKKEVQKRTEEIDSANKKLLQQKDQIENSDRFGKAIINSVQSGIVTIDREQRITSINEKGLAMLSVAREELLSKEISATVLNEMFNVNRHIEALNNGKFLRNQESEVVMNGKEVTFASSLYPLNDLNRQMIGAVLSFEDISQEKKLREELARMDKMKSLGVIVAGFAHEIRNPLTSIKALSDMIPTKIDDPRFRKNFTQIIPTQIGRLDNLISDLLDYTKPKSPDMQRVNIGEVINHTFALFQKTIDDKLVQHSVAVDEDLEVLVDKQQIMQVFINLILNSLDAVPKKGSIRVYAVKSEEYVEIVVEDNGGGIPKEIADKVMDPFFTTKNDGTGLGLFICYQLVQKNNGQINIVSEINHGTKVSVQLMIPNEEEL